MSIRPTKVLPRPTPSHRKRRCAARDLEQCVVAILLVWSRIWYILRVVARSHSLAVNSWPRKNSCSDFA